MALWSLDKGIFKFESKIYEYKFFSPTLSSNDVVIISTATATDFIPCSNPMPLLAPITERTLPPSDKTLSIYYHNASGIRSKSREMYLSVLENEYDVICITETWLTGSHNSAEYFPPDYYVFRRDRYTVLESTARGGGVLIAVSKNMGADIIDLGSKE